MKFKFVNAIVALAASSILAFGASNPKVITIGYAGVGSGNRPVGGGAYLNTEADWGSFDKDFKADGIEIKRIYFSGAGPAVNEALANQQLDLAWQGDLPGLVGRSGGLPTKLILAVSRFDAIYIAVPSGSRAQSLEDLKGKRVAVFKGTNLQLAFYKLLASKGLKDTDFKLLNMSTADGDAAILSGDIDALVTGADIFPLVDRGVARIVEHTRGRQKDSRLTHLLVTESFSKKYPQLVQRIVNASLVAAAWSSDEKNRAANYQTWVKSGFGLSAWAGDHDWDQEILRNSPLFDTFYRDQYKRLLQVAVQLKLVRRPFDIDGWIDSHYLEQGLKDLHLEHFWPEQDTNGQPRH